MIGKKIPNTTDTVKEKAVMQFSRYIIERSNLTVGLRLTACIIRGRLLDEMLVKIAMKQMMVQIVRQTQVRDRTYMFQRLKVEDF